MDTSVDLFFSGFTLFASLALVGLVPMPMWLRLLLILALAVFMFFFGRRAGIQSVGPDEGRFEESRDDALMVTGIGYVVIAAFLHNHLPTVAGSHLYGWLFQCGMVAVILYPMHRAYLSWRGPDRP